MTIFYIACFLGLISLVSGLLVILRAGNKPENRVFLAVSLLSIVWSVTFASIELPNNIETVDLLRHAIDAFGHGVYLLFPQKTTSQNSLHLRIFHYTSGVS
jgi:hypothetical protein